MITVGGTLILAIGGAAWRVGIRLGMVEQGLAGCDDSIRELRTDIREFRAEIRESRADSQTDIRELRAEIREVNRKVDRIIERLPPPGS